MTTTVAELIGILRELPADLPVHVWTREEEFGDLSVIECAGEPTSGYSGPVARIEGA